MMSRSYLSRIGVASALLACLLAACGPREDAGQLTPPASNVETTVDTIQGVVHIRNTGDPPWWSSELLLNLGSIGSVGEAAPDEFGQITSAVLGPQGHLYVADSYAREIKVFDLDGVLVSRFGRGGQGPGEYGSLYSLAWMGNTLLALDLGNGRIAELSPDGEWLGQRRAPGSVSGSPASLRFYPVGPDQVYAWSLVAAGDELESVYIRHTPEGPADTVPYPDRGPRPRHYILCDRSDGMIAAFDIPFAPEFLHHPAQNGEMAVVWSAEYRIAFLNAAGDTVRVVERETTPLPVTEEAFEEGLTEYREFLDEYGAQGCDPRSPEMPEYRPPVVGLYLDPLGRTWIEAEHSSGKIWEVFDMDGRLVGRLPAIARNDRTVPYIVDSLLSVVTEDSLDVPLVQVYRYGPEGG